MPGCVTQCDSARGCPRCQFSSRCQLGTLDAHTARGAHSDKAKMLLDVTARCVQRVLVLG